MNFFVSLCAAVVVSSEGWNIFIMIALSTLISPYLMGIGMIDAIGTQIKTNNVVWSLPALGLLAAHIGVIVIALGVTSWVQSRKASFL
jgi:ABC-2 type transport system permease protein